MLALYFKPGVLSERAIRVMSINISTVVEPLEVRSYNFGSKGNAFTCFEHMTPIPSLVQESLQK